MSIRHALALLLVVPALPAAIAQDLNVKFGSGAPSATYGGLAIQPGTWSVLRAGQTIVLAGLQGQATAATASHDGTCDDESCNLCPLDCPSQGPPDQRDLMRSFFDSDCQSPGPRVTVAALAEGRYTMNTYAVTACEIAAVVHYTLRVVDGAGVTTFSSSFDMGGGTSPNTLYSHADDFDLPSGSSVELGFGLAFGGPCGVQLTKVDEIVNACSGDGSGIACPCGNSGASGHGCANSLFAAGGLLTAHGIASVSSDSLVLSGTNMSNASCTYFQGSTLAPAPLFDGILCVGGNLLRIGSKINAGNGSSYPGPGDPSVSVRGQIAAAGGTFYYTTRYRNAASFCTPDTANLTNAIAVTWAP